MAVEKGVSQQKINQSLNQTKRRP